jgi:hypothetical protein
MPHTSSDELFRKAAEAEGGMPVSAGARVAHVQLALQSGRAFHIDLSAVPEDKRSAVIAEIGELVKRASTGTKPGSPQPATDPATPAG